MPSGNRQWAVVLVHSRPEIRTRLAAVLQAAAFEVIASPNWREVELANWNTDRDCVALVEAAQVPEGERQGPRAFPPGAVVIRLLDYFGPDAADQVALAHPTLPGAVERCRHEFLPRELSRILSGIRPPAPTD